MDWNKIALATTVWCLESLWDNVANRFRPATIAAPGDPAFDYMWANGIAFSMLVGATRHAPKAYRSTLDRFFAGMEPYWGATSRPPGYDASPAHGEGSDKYYDDNAWMVLTFAEAFAVTKDTRYKDRADAALRFVLSGWDEKLGGGIYWREDRKSKNTCANAPAATAAIEMARFGEKKERVEWAKRIVTWTKKILQDPSDGLYWDNIVPATGVIEKTKWTYNTALMIRAHLLLWKLTGSKPDRDEAVRLAEASERVFVLPETGAFRDDANFSHLLCEAYLLLWRETKQPWLKARAVSCGTFVVTRLAFPDGGYRSSWRLPVRESDRRKTLMANASTARLFWCLAQTA